MLGLAGSASCTVYVDITLTRSKVIVKVTEHLNFRQLPSYYTDYTDSVRVENIWLNVEKNHDKFIIGGIYRHPRHSIDAFSQELEKCLSISASQYNCW